MACFVTARSALAAALASFSFDAARRSLRASPSFLFASFSIAWRLRYLAFARAARAFLASRSARLRSRASARALRADFGAMTVLRLALVTQNNYTNSWMATLRYARELALPWHPPPKKKPK